MWKNNKTLGVVGAFIGKYYVLIVQLWNKEMTLEENTTCPAKKIRLAQCRTEVRNEPTEGRA